MAGIKDCVGWYPVTRNPNIASVRLRCLNPIQHLHRTGFPVALYRPNCWKSRNYKIVVFSKNYSPGALDQAQRLKRDGVKIVFDLCDNRFYNPANVEAYNNDIRRLTTMAKLADRVVTSTPRLAEIVENEVGVVPIIIGDPLESRPRVSMRSYVDLAAQAPNIIREWARLAEYRRQGLKGLVWFGNHGSSYADAGGLQDLGRIKDALEDMVKKTPFFLTVISNNYAKYLRVVKGWQVPSLYFHWNPLTFRRLLSLNEICVIPIHSNPFTICKTSNRVAEALNSGLAVVADPIPSYQEFSEAIVLGDWRYGLATYLTSDIERASAVRRGRSLVESKCSLREIAGHWKNLFEELGVHA